ncbi:ORF6N domain protein [Bacteroidales bacterium Barb4]|nr:ORF6N domain protein [Bacteroidales bacterium Barb4]
MELSVIQSRIFEVRGQKAMLDYDLAELYQVETRTLKQSVRRNINRFPSDFMFEITREEYNSLRSQFVILEDNGADSNRGKHSKYLPFAFTEQGVAMLSSVLHSEAAIEVNIAIIRVFVAVRNYFTIQTSIPDEIRQLKERMSALENLCNENLKAVNDLSEDTRRDIDSVYIALTEMAERKKQLENRPRIGFNQ